MTSLIRINTKVLKAPYRSYKICNFSTLPIMGWMVVPTCDIHVKEPLTMTVFGKRIFADVIKTRIWRWDHPGLSTWALILMTSVLMRGKKKIDGIQEKRKSHTKMQAETELYSHKPRNTWSHQELEKTTKIPSRAFRVRLYSPANTLI